MTNTKKEAEMPLFVSGEYEVLSESSASALDFLQAEKTDIDVQSERENNL